MKVNIMKYVIIALILFCSPVVACEVGNCWINDYIAYQHNRMNNNDRFIYIDLSRQAFIHMHKLQSDKTYIFNNAKLNVSDSDRKKYIKEIAYKEMIELYPCKEKFLMYLFFNKKM